MAKERESSRGTNGRTSRRDAGRPGRDIIVVGASAGGVEALRTLVAGLPHDYLGTLFVVLHTSPTSTGVLAQILDRAGPLSATHAVHGEPLRRGHIFVAPPDHHLLLTQDAVLVTRGPKENGFRPAVDPMFRTAARMFGARTVGIVLSGGLDDGTAGLQFIKLPPGVAIAQSPDDAMFPSMPTSAVQNVKVDHVLPVAEMPAVLAELARRKLTAKEQAMSRSKAKGPDVAEAGTDALKTGKIDGTPSGYTCPECEGAVWEIREGKLVRYRCHTGHGFSADTLAAEQLRALEGALWSALRALEENASLRRRMADRAAERSWGSMEKQYRDQAVDAEDRAALLREVLVSDEVHAPPDLKARALDRRTGQTDGRPTVGKRNGSAEPNGSANGRRPRKKRQH